MHGEDALPALLDLRVSLLDEIVVVTFQLFFDHWLVLTTNSRFLVADELLGNES